MKKLILLIMVSLTILGCNNNEQVHEEFETDGRDHLFWGNYEKVGDRDISNDLFVIEDQWALVTAGNNESFNTMTISWGGFGTLWNKKVAFIFIRDSRYTIDFLNKYDSFTIEFFSEKYKKALEICGTKSGRDSNKVSEAGLTPITTPSGSMAFKEGYMIIECKKLYSQMLNPENFNDSTLSGFYDTGDGVHKMFIGEIVNVWKE